MTWEGLLLVDKPQGPTSHDIVARIRKATGQRRVGHAGTLDPMASGLLPLVLGRATRLVRFLPHDPKEYRGSLRLGLTTGTDDVTGEVLTCWEAPLPAAVEVLEAAARFVGLSMQVPPAVSAARSAGSGCTAWRARASRSSAEPTAGEGLSLRPRADGSTRDLLRSWPRFPPEPTSDRWPATWERPSAAAARWPRCAARRSDRCGPTRGSPSTPPDPPKRPGLPRADPAGADAAGSAGGPAGA